MNVDSANIQLAKFPKIYNQLSGTVEQMLQHATGPAIACIYKIQF